ncbi:P2RX7 protein, partial [Brachypteracias leptosomus]|nr:P2RX7 protein [Brachypteracias leptosomus]
IIIYRLYEEKDEITSSVRTSVKGVVYAANRTWDAAEYTATNSFFVMTNLIKTEKQVQQKCPEYPFNHSICSSDEFCEKGSVNVHSNGIQTGRCVDYNATIKTCEVSAWCPVESMEKPPKPAVLRSSENFTVLIKINIHFPKFNLTVVNIPPVLNTFCTYNKDTDPSCPIFRLGDILQELKENFSEFAVKGGIIAIEINWNCNLDSWFYDCSPKYSFRRLDHRKVNPGFHFRYARHYKLADGVEQRTLFKVYGIRFDVLVFGTGRKFNSIELIKSIGSMISYFALVRDLCFVLIKPVLEIHFIKKLTLLLSAAAQVVYVSHVDEPQVTLVKMPLKTSLQHAQGSILEGHPVKFGDAGNRCISESNKNHDDEELELGQPLRHEASSLESLKWCCCGRCQPAQEYHEQLCCRRNQGQCLTTSQGFQQLVLSSDSLKKALLYKEPFLDVTAGNLNTQLRHLAYEQYIHWHFGADLQDRAVIPNCCRWKIRESYPKPFNNYTGFKIE